MYHIIKNKKNHNFLKKQQLNYILLQHFLILKMFIFYTSLSSLILSNWLKTCEHAHPKARWKCPWLFSWLSRTLSASFLLLLWFIFSSDFPASQAPLWPSIIDICPHLAQDRWAGAGFPSPTANWCERFWVSNLTRFRESSTCWVPSLPVLLFLGSSLKGSGCKGYFKPACASMSRLEIWC